MCLQGHRAMATLCSHTREGPRQISNYPHQHLTTHLLRRDRRNLCWYKTHLNSKWDLLLRGILKNLKRRPERCKHLPSERSKALTYFNQPWAWRAPPLINCSRSSIKALIMKMMPKPSLLSSLEETHPRFWLTKTWHLRKNRQEPTCCTHKGSSLRNLGLSFRR